MMNKANAKVQAVDDERPCLGSHSWCLPSDDLHKSWVCVLCFSESYGHCLPLYHRRRSCWTVGLLKKFLTTPWEIPRIPRLLFTPFHWLLTNPNIEHTAGDFILKMLPCSSVVCHTGRLWAYTVRHMCRRSTLVKSALHRKVSVFYQESPGLSILYPSKATWQEPSFLTFVMSYS